MFEFFEYNFKLEQEYQTIKLSFKYQLFVKNSQ